MENIFCVTEYGASSNNEKIQTKAIQHAIDACRDFGGGRVTIPSGKYLVGSLRLYSNITLYLESGAYLLGSQRLEDYQDFNVPTSIKYLHNDFYIKSWNLPAYYFYAMITAFKAENVAIIGEPGSVIDGADVFDPNGEEKFRGPMGIIMSGVKNLKLAGYTFQNSANWSHTLDGCEDVEIERVTLKAGHDGFNLHHSENIIVSDCRLETGDDCFAGYDIHNLLVKRCWLNTACNSMRIGGVNLIFNDCTFLGPGIYPHLSEATHYTHAIFKFYSIDADDITENAENITINNCIIDDADRLFFYDYGKKELMQNHVPLRSLTLSNARVSGIRHTSPFLGNGENCILTLENVTINHPSEEAFLKIDESIKLVLKNVIFELPTKIIVGNTSLLFSKQVNLEIG